MECLDALEAPSLRDGQKAAELRCARYSSQFARKRP